MPQTFDLSGAAHCAATPKLTEINVKIDLVTDSFQAYVDGVADVVVNEISDPLLEPSVLEDRKEAFKQQLDKYMRYCTFSRVRQVNHHPLAHPPVSKVWVIPPFLSTALEQIGVVESEEFGIVLRPVLTEEQTSEWKGSYSTAEFERVSRRLGAIFRRSHLEYAQGLPKSIEGSLDAMTMQVVNDEVRSLTNRPHPLNALIAAFLRLRYAEDVLIGHVSYGTVAEVSRDLRGVADYEHKS